MRRIIHIRIENRTASWLLLVVMVTVMCAGCGDSDGSGGQPTVPRRSDPAFGHVGNVLISDRFDDIDGVRDEIWIGFNQQKEWDDFVASNQGRPSLPPLWIGGHLIVDANHHLGFYFDPDTTSSAEVTAETIQTNIDLLKRPEFAATQLTWVISAAVEKILPGGN